MTEATNGRLKLAFQNVFPDHAARMEAAQSDEELMDLREGLIAECQKNLNSALALADSKPAILGAAQQDVSLVLTPEQQRVLAAAKGGRIEKVITELLKMLEKATNVKNPTPAVLSSGLVAAGVVSVAWPSASAVCALVEVCSSSSSEAVLIDGMATVIATEGGGAAAAAGASIGVIVAAVILALAILSAVIYCFASSRKCVILFVNELDQPLTFGSANFVHGDKDSMLYTKEIPGAIRNPEMGIFPGAGFIVADRLAGLYGTQFGFNYKYGARKLAVGALCGYKNDNQCWCDIDKSPADVAKSLVKEKNLRHEAAKEKLKLTIQCNAHRGNPAFFVVRAHSS